MATKLNRTFLDYIDKHFPFSKKLPPEIILKLVTVTCWTLTQSQFTQNAILRLDHYYFYLRFRRIMEKILQAMERNWPYRKLKIIFKSRLNRFPNVSFWFPWKHQKTFGSLCFLGDEKETLGRKELTSCFDSKILLRKKICPGIIYNLLYYKCSNCKAT